MPKKFNSVHQSEPCCTTCSWFNVPTCSEGFLLCPLVIYIQRFLATAIAIATPHLFLVWRHELRFPICFLYDVMSNVCPPVPCMTSWVMFPHLYYAKSCIVVPQKSEDPSYLDIACWRRYLMTSLLTEIGCFHDYFCNYVCSLRIL